MSTHYSTCVVCSKKTYCSEDAAALGCGASCYEEGPQIEFCSLACFDALAARMAVRRGIYMDLVTEAECTTR